MSEQPQSPRPPAGSALSVGAAVRLLVAEAAPGESSQFDHIATVFFDDPARLLGPRGEREESTAFGASEAEGLLTTIALAVVSGVVSDTVKQVVERTIRRRPGGGRWARIRGRGRSDGAAVLDTPLPRLGPEQVEALKEQARELGAQAHVATETLNALCAALDQVLSDQPAR
jgi:hypothetical protein